MPKQISLFSFGYYGWGNSTPQLVQAADAVERSRGFKPPIFVDLRIQRSVRAPGFNGNTFGSLFGQKRYVWMKSLGNLQIKTRTGPIIQIAKPEAVNDLLDLAIEAAKDRRRLIFYCQCEWPSGNPNGICHRTRAATLALLAAKRRGLNVEFVAWPGGKPSHIHINADSKNFNELLGGRFKIPADNKSLSSSAGIAWGSIATVHSDGQKALAVIGPAQYRYQQWQHQVFAFGEGYTIAEIQQLAARVRRKYGFEPRATG